MIFIIFTIFNQKGNLKTGDPRNYFFHFTTLFFPVVHDILTLLALIFHAFVDLIKLFFEKITSF